MSHKLKRYRNGDEYITGGVASIEPNVDYEPEEYELDMDDDEIRRFKENKNNRSLRRKMRKL